MGKSWFYAVRRGRQPGVYTCWAHARAQVEGFSGCDHRRFGDRRVAEHYVECGYVECGYKEQRTKITSFFGPKEIKK